MNFRNFKNILKIGLCLIAFSLLGGVLSWVAKAFSFENPRQEINAGSGSFLFAILGGYGSVISDFIWIRAYVYWERQDLDNCIANMDLALAINPHSKMFWTYASSTLAYDSPHWIAEKRGSQNMKQIGRIQGKKALKYLEKALEYFPNDRGLLMDSATIYVQKLDDLKSAIAIYKKICENEDRLVFTRRAYANLLAQDGQLEEAKKVLRQVLGDVPKGSDIYREVAHDLASVGLE